VRKAPLTSSWSLSALTKSSILTAVSGNLGWTVTQPAFLSIASGQKRKRDRHEGGEQDQKKRKRGETGYSNVI